MVVPIPVGCRRVWRLLALATILAICVSGCEAGLPPLANQVAPTTTPIPPTLTPAPTATPVPPTISISPTGTPGHTVPVYTYEIVSAYPHDRDASTQGLVFHEGVLYEGTGLRGRSTLRRVALESGEVLQLQALPDEVFGEGIAIFGDRIVQLTWQARVGFVYDVHEGSSFKLVREFHYPTEGWGITHDGQRLIVSDGTSTLYFWDPESLEEIGRIEVAGENGPVLKLNELEYVTGEVYANVWQTNRIARIDPGTGQVTGWVDLVGLLDPADQAEPVGVLNGIAYDAEGDRLFVTGKLWPKLFEIELVPLE